MTTVYVSEAKSDKERGKRGKNKATRRKITRKGNDEMNSLIQKDFKFIDHSTSKAKSDKKRGKNEATRRKRTRKTENYVMNSLIQKDFKFIDCAATSMTPIYISEEKSDKQNEKSGKSKATGRKRTRETESNGMNSLRQKKLKFIDSSISMTNSHLSEAKSDKDGENKGTSSERIGKTKNNVIDLEQEDSTLMDCSKSMTNGHLSKASSDKNRKKERNKGTRSKRIVETENNVMNSLNQKESTFANAPTTPLTNTFRYRPHCKFINISGTGERSQDSKHIQQNVGNASSNRRRELFVLTSVSLPTVSYDSSMPNFDRKCVSNGRTFPPINQNAVLQTFNYPNGSQEQEPSDPNAETPSHYINQYSLFYDPSVLFDLRSFPDCGIYPSSQSATSSVEEYLPNEGQQINYLNSGYLPQGF